MEPWHVFDRLADDPETADVAIFAVGVFQRNEPLLTRALRRLARSWGDDLFRHRLMVAGVALGELAADTSRRVQGQVDAIAERVVRHAWHHAVHSRIALCPLAGRAVDGCSRAGRVAGRPAGQWLVETASSCADDRFDYLIQIGSRNPEVVEALVGRLRIRSASMRLEAAEALAERGVALEAVAGCLWGITENEEFLVHDADRVAINFGLVPKRAVPKLAAALSNTDAEVRSASALRLGELRVATPRVIEAIAAKLEDPVARVRVSAAAALVALGATTPSVVAYLVTGLRHPDSSVRQAAVEAIGGSNHHREVVIDALLATLDDPAISVRGESALALGRLRMATPVVLAALTSSLDDPGWSVRATSAVALGRLRCASPGVVAGLSAALSDDVPAVRGEAARALAQVDASTREVISTLESRIGDPDMVFAVATALLKLEPGHAGALAKLCTLCRSPDRAQRLEAVESLRTLADLPARAVFALGRRLLDRDGWVRAAAAEALAAFRVRLYRTWWGGLRYSTPIGIGIRRTGDALTRHCFVDMILLAIPGRVMRPSRDETARFPRPLFADLGEADLGEIGEAERRELDELVDEVLEADSEDRC